MTLLEECLQILGENVIVFKENETNELFKKLENTYEFTNWGRIDWDKIFKKQKLNSSKELIKYLKQKNICNEDMYILWDEASLPAVKANLFKILSNLDDVTAVSFNTWLFDIDSKLVIEFYHDEEIILSQ